MRDFKKEVQQIATELKDIMTKCGQTDQAEALYNTVTYKLDNFTPTLMFYGTYNSGKSTLLNAIMGQPLAAMADAPETSIITEYSWDGYKIVDSPGLDAPVEHEKMSKEHLSKADVILFVVSTNGTFEDKKVYEELQAIIDVQKPLVIVLNNKTNLPMDSEEIGTIKIKLMENLAKVTGNKNVGEKYSVILVNAKSALKGRMENKSLLVQKSGIETVENVILANLKSMEGLQQLITPLTYMEGELSRFQLILQANMDDGQSQLLEQMLAEVSTQKKSVYNTLKNRLTGYLLDAQPQLVNAVKSQQSPQQVFERIIKNIEADFKEEIMRSQEALENSFDFINAKNVSDKITSNISGNYGGAEAGYDLDQSIMQAEGNQASKMLLDTAKTYAITNPQGVEELAKEGLLLARKLKIPGISGRWESTLGKWAGTVSKYVGPLLTLVQIGYDWYKANQAQEAYEAAQKAREQEIQSAVKLMISDIERDIMVAIKEQVNETYLPLEQKLKSLFKTEKDSVIELQKSLRIIEEYKWQINSLKTEINR